MVLIKSFILYIFDDMIFQKFNSIYIRIKKFCISDENNISGGNSS